MSLEYEHRSIGFAFSEHSNPPGNWWFTNNIRHMCKFDDKVHFLNEEEKKLSDGNGSIVMSLPDRVDIVKRAIDRFLKEHPLE